MISIAEIFDNSKQLLDSITGFVDKYIGCSLLRKCDIRKIVDDVKKNADPECYALEYTTHLYCGYHLVRKEGRWKS